MSLFQWMGRWWGNPRRIEELAEQIAARHVEDVHRRLSRQALRMSAHELKGYVRSHAVPVVRHAIRDAAAEYGITASRGLGQFQTRVVDAITRRVQQDVTQTLLSRGLRSAA
ncbi:MAG: hypothetical protein AB7O38_25930 [Pirellulaceae bacterium]